MNDQQKHRLTHFSTKTVVISAVLLASLILLNLLVTWIPKKYTLLDTSHNRLHSITETTKDAVSRLTEDVTIYYLCEERIENNTIRTFLNRYAELSDHIRIEVVDPFADPVFTAQYTSEELSNHSLILETKKRFLVLDYYDLYLIHSEYYGTMTYDEYLSYASSPSDSYILESYGITQYFNGESRVTNGLTYVTTDEIPKIYALSSHGEATLGETFLGELKNAAFEVVTEMNLLTGGKVPEDCDILLLNAPKKDISEDEKQWIADYLKKGGSLFLCTSAGETYTTTEDEDGIVTESEFPNLTDLLLSYELSATNGIVVETDASRIYSNRPTLLLPPIASDHPITEGFESTFILFYEAHGIRIGKESSDLSLTPLFFTSEDAYTHDGTGTNLNRQETSEDGPFALGAIAESKTRGSIVWFSSGNLLENAVDRAVSGGNYTYVISALGHLTEREDLMTLPAVSLEEPTLVITQNDVTVLATLFCAVVPLAVLIPGIVYYYKRQKR